MTRMAVRGNYGKWSSTELALALAAFRNGNCGLNECARMYNIPKATLKRHLENRNLRANDRVKILGRTTFLPKELEDELEAIILIFEERLFEMTTKDIRKLAFQIAERGEIRHRFNKETRMAGKAWYYSFMARHTQLSQRQTESTSTIRARGFNRERVDGFFNILEKIVDKYKLNGYRIFNVDESALMTVQGKPQKIVGYKKRSQADPSAYGDKGVNTTIVCCVSASSFYIPPMVIFKQKYMAPELGVGAPSGSLIQISDTGYINSELFVLWLKHFHSMVQSSPKMPVLLLLDGNVTHSKNIDAITYARESGIILLQVPGHTTHRLQPLDDAFFKPLQTYYTLAQEQWLQTNVDSTMTPFHVSGLLGKAYSHVASAGIAEKAFRSSGLWPVNRHIFNDHYFAA
ncbi:MFS-type transporter clz9-like isoform X2 [Athalia rosae]|uniref:MFS-type transporter clz9-like isoform X2 n=1 Tax=Athalia rosae TaxID=37344 RepID=UPI0020333BF4|nr:MFS-type transporter clz9-like isoform X2 [Athalia rosae]